MAAKPHASLVASLGRTIEPLVHAPDAVHTARISGVAVVDDAVLEHEGTHALTFTRIRTHVRACHGSEHSRTGSRHSRLSDDHHGVIAAEVVFGPFALLLLSERRVEVKIEVAVMRRCPG